MRVYIIGNDGITLCRTAPGRINNGEIAVAWNRGLHAAPAQRQAVAGAVERSAVSKSERSRRPRCADRCAVVGNERPCRIPSRKPTRSAPPADVVIAMLRLPEGATVDEVASVTGSQRHTVRGVFSGTLKKKLGLTLASAKEERQAGSIASPSRPAYETSSPRRFGSPALWRAVLWSRCDDCRKDPLQGVALVENRRVGRIIDTKAAACLADFYHAGPPLGLGRDLIIRGLADKLQQHAHGGPSRLERRLQGLAGEFEALVLSTRPEAPKTGATLVRQWRGHAHTVLVREDGFEYDGRRYRSLTGIASGSPGRVGSVPGSLVSASEPWLRRRGQPMKKPGTAVRRSGTVRCAIYTRKWSEEDSAGIQFAAGAARSLRGLHRRPAARRLGVLRTPYDGGSPARRWDRPALRRLLADITAGRVDTVVVYKIDRLTRSLADFPRSSRSSMPRVPPLSR